MNKKKIVTTIFAPSMLFGSLFLVFYLGDYNIYENTPLVLEYKDIAEKNSEAVIAEPGPDTNNAGYEKKENAVFYNGKEVAGADPASFEKLIDIKKIKNNENEEDIYRDSDDVFYRGVKVLDANPEKFELHKGSDFYSENYKIFKDDKNVYLLKDRAFYQVEVSEIKPDDFEYLSLGNPESGYIDLFKTSRGVYRIGYNNINDVHCPRDMWCGTVVSGNENNNKGITVSKLDIYDPKSFEVVTRGYSLSLAKDNKYVYSIGSNENFFKIFKELDPKSVDCPEPGKRDAFVCKDSDFIYFSGDNNIYNGQKNGIDLKSFGGMDGFEIGMGIFKDKNGVYSIYDSKISKLELNVKEVSSLSMDRGSAFIFDNKNIFIIEYDQKPKMIFHGNEKINTNLLKQKYLLTEKSVYFLSEDSTRGLEFKKLEKADPKSFSVFECSKICGKDGNGNVYVEDKLEKADNYNYASVLIGNQRWMTSNLNVGTMLDSAAAFPTDNKNIEKWCYNNDISICSTDGGLYGWDEAMQYSTEEGAQGICPSGWHIPTDAEWHILEDYLKDEGQTCDANRNAKETLESGCAMAGKKVAKGGSSKMNLPFAGFRSAGGTFYGRDGSGEFLSSSQNTQDNTKTWRRSIASPGSSKPNSKYPNSISRHDDGKEYGLSVRCIKN